MSGFAERRERLVRDLRAVGGSAAPARLGKQTSNLFRDREETPRRRLDVRDFDHVLATNADEGWVDVEGMTPYEALVDATAGQTGDIPRDLAVVVGFTVLSLVLGAATLRRQTP